MAKGSHTTRGGWEPRTCCLCGQPVKVSSQTDGALRFMFDHYTKRVFAWHQACEQPGWPHLNNDVTLKAGGAR